MVSIEDFIIKNNNSNRGSFLDLYVSKIEKYQKKTLRLLEDKESNLIKKFLKVHSYLPGIGNSACNMTQENLDIESPCKFCVEFVNQINAVIKEQLEWLGTTSIAKEIKVNEETKKGTLVLNNGKIYEEGTTFEKEIASLLTEADRKIYDSLMWKKNRVEGKLAKAKFLAPVYDYGEGTVKIYEFGPAVFNAIENAFTIPGYSYTSADFLITHNAQLGNWWIVSKRDSAPVEEKILEKYNLLKDKLAKELDRRATVPTPGEQTELFQKYLNGVEKKAAKERGEDVSEKKPGVAKETPTETKKEEDVDLF